MLSNSSFRDFLLKMPFYVGYLRREKLRRYIGIESAANQPFRRSDLDHSGSNLATGSISHDGYEGCAGINEDIALNSRSG